MLKFGHAGVLARFETEAAIRPILLSYFLASTPRGKSCPLCGGHGKDFPRIKCTSNCLILVQPEASSLASGCTRRSRIETREQNVVFDVDMPLDIG